MLPLIIGGVALILSQSKNTPNNESKGLPMGDAFTRYDALFKKYGLLFGVDWLMVKAICMNETLLGAVRSVSIGLSNPKDIEGSKSSDGLSWGLMQVTLSTARTMDASATAEKLNNAEYSIRLGAQYLSQMQKMYFKSEPRFIEWVVKSYNQGPGNTRKERDGKIKGYAQEYWERYQRNYLKAKKAVK